MTNTICLNDILDAISIRLNEVFGKTYTIYTNNIEQGFSTPCFFIKILPESRSKKLGNRYYNETSFVIHVFLENATVEELNDISETLYQTLEVITLVSGDMIRGNNMKKEINDDVLEFFIDYNYFTYKEVEKVDAMETIEVNGEVKKNA